MPLNGIIKLRDNLKVFDLAQEQEDIMRGNAERLTDIMAEQMAQGRDITGQIRADEYAPFTVRYKRELGQGLGSVTDRVTFYMTGKLYASLFAAVSARTVEIKSPLETYDKMLERVGRANYGFSPDSAGTVREEIVRPQLSAIMLQKLGLHM